MKRLLRTFFAVFLFAAGAMAQEHPTPAPGARRDPYANTSRKRARHHKHNKKIRKHTRKHRHNTSSPR